MKLTLFSVDLADRNYDLKHLFNENSRILRTENPCSEKDVDVSFFFTSSPASLEPHPDEKQGGRLISGIHIEYMGNRG